MTESLKELCFRPLQFLQRRSYQLVAGVYVSTYVAANLTDTICSRQMADSRYPKFVTTSATNIAVGIAKDRAFTRMFGLKPPTQLPAGTYVLFALRDSATIAASFTAPVYMARYMQTNHGYSKEFAMNFSQLTCPVLIQFLSTPPHLLGLDLYNNPHHTTRERFQFMRREYVKSASARMARIFPAFGIGGVLNRKLRKGLNPQGAPPTYLFGRFNTG